MCKKLLLKVQTFVCNAHIVLGVVYHNDPHVAGGHVHEHGTQAASLDELKAVFGEYGEHERRIACNEVAAHPADVHHEEMEVHIEEETAVHAA